MPRTSIVIPAYNSARFLGPALEAVQAQTDPDWEVLVVDDGSTDATSEVAQRFATADGRMRVVRQTNGGVALARNRGFALTDPEASYVMFLDHDDLLVPTALELLADALEQQPGVVGAHGLAMLIDAEGYPWRKGELEQVGRHRLTVVGDRLVPVPPGAPTRFGSVVLGVLDTGGQLLVRRASLDGLEPFDPDLPLADDFDFWVRLAARGDLAFVNQVVLKYRYHETNASRASDRVLAGQVLARLKWAVSPDLSPEQRRVLAVTTSDLGEWLSSWLAVQDASADLRREAVASVTRSVKAMRALALATRPEPALQVAAQGSLMETVKYLSVFTNVSWMDLVLAQRRWWAGQEID